MILASKRKIWNEGTSQKRREEQALTVSNFDVDERSFDSLVAEVFEISKAVSFHQPENIDSKRTPLSWNYILESNEIFILSQFKLLNLKSYEDRFYTYYRPSLTSGSVQNLFKSVSVITDLGQVYIRWLGFLSKLDKNAPQVSIYDEWMQAFNSSSGVEIREKPSEKNDSEETHETRKEADKQKKKDESHIHESVLNVLRYLIEWEEKRKKGDKYFPFIGIKDVEEFFQTLIKISYFLRSKHDHFMELAQAHQSHEPHNGLLFTFLKLFQTAQSKINQFTDRHTDFYYRDLLGLSPREATPDRTYLRLMLEDDISSYRLRKNTPFLAGTDDDDQPIIYTTTEDLQLDHCQIRAIKGVQVVKDSNSYDEILSPTTKIVKREYPLEVMSRPLPIMDMHSGSLKEIESADIGFAISSPNLDLADGYRKIEIKFIGGKRYYGLKNFIVEALEKDKIKSNKDITLGRIIKVSYKEHSAKVMLGQLLTNSFEKSLEPGAVSIPAGVFEHILDNPRLAQKTIGEKGDYKPDETLADLLRGIEGKSGIKIGESVIHSLHSMIEERHEMDPDVKENGKVRKRKRDYTARKFGRLFKEALKISYTSTDGWVDIKPAKVILEPIGQNEHELTIDLRLRAEDPPLVINEDLTFENPAIRFILNEGAPEYPYDFLNKIDPHHIICEVEVRELKNLTLYNQIGQINPDGPFLPFGPTPNTYSYLLIGNKEVFRKKVESVEVNVNWMDLPAIRGGFPYHYREYDEGYDNNAFKAEVSMLSGGTWTPEKLSREQFELFECKEFLEDSMTYKLNVGKLNLGADFTWNPEELVFDKKTNRGFIRFQLAHPQQSFGHEEYPGLLSKSVIEGTKKVNGLVSKLINKHIQIDLPNSPYTPKIGRISLNYRQKFHIKFQDTVKHRQEDHDEFYHLHPFGGKKRIIGDGKWINLLPDFADEGTLLIGFDKVETPFTVSMLFNLVEQQVDEDENQDQRVIWSVLINNTWRRLENHEIPKDTTSGLIHSGIVKLLIPRIRETSNSILPDDLIWVKAACKSDVDILAKFFSIQNHAVEMKYQTPSGELFGNHRIKADSITEPEKDIPELSEISQPLPSFGGLEPESDKRFNIRISERLRHRGRAVNMYDYERIILEEFPSINKVLCISSFNWEKNRVEAGTVLLVLVPRLTNSYFDLTTPSNSVHTLRGVKNFISSKSSPFARFNVVNPTYEKVRVFASVAIDGEYSVGECLQNLNRKLREFIAPWLADPSAEPMFQRTIAVEEVESLIQSQPYVQLVGDVSIIKIYKNRITSIKRKHRLTDTGAKGRGIRRKKVADPTIRGFYPWSILTTADDHSLKHMDESGPEFGPTYMAGLDDLYIQEDYVVPLNNPDI